MRSNNSFKHTCNGFSYVIFGEIMGIILVKLLSPSSRLTMIGLINIIKMIVTTPKHLPIV